MTRWKFEVTDNGQVVAEGDAPDRVAAIGEAAHYVRMYGQDGGIVSGTVWPGDERSPRQS